MRRRSFLSGLRRACLLPALIVLSLMLLPVAVVIAISIGASPTYQFPPSALSLRWFTAFLGNPTFRDALLGVSLPLGIGVSLVATVLGTLAAIGITRGRFRARRLVELLFVAPIVFPQILLGVGLFMLYARLGWSPSILTLGLGHVLIGTPYVIRTVSGGLAGVDAHLEQAAQNLGASPVQAFCRVTLPIIRSSILSGAIFAFIISFSDINLALFLAAADAATLPVQILAQMQYASDPTIAAASTIQVAVIGILVFVAQRSVAVAKS